MNHVSTTMGAPTGLATITMGDNLKFVKDLPQSVQNEISKILDEDDNWEKVVKRFMDVEINIFSIEDLKHESSPAQKLIQLFSHQNIKIWHLYLAVATLSLHNVMSCLEDYVEADVSMKVKEEMNRSKVSSKNDTKITYIHQLPEDVRIGLSSVLDADDSWKLLVARFECAGFDYYTLESCKREVPSSPSSEFLKILGDRNFQISHLYTAFASMDHSKAMSFLEDYVSENLKKTVLSDLMRNGRQRDTRGIVNISNVQDVHSVVLGVTDFNDDMQSNSKDSDAEKLNRYGNKSLETAIICKSSNLQPDVKTRVHHQEVGRFAEISYRQLLVATSGWIEEKRLGPKDRGNFYHGKWDDTDVAIKRLRLKKVNQHKHLLEELRILKDVKHKRVLKMFNFVEGDNNPCLIYPFMKNGSLCDFLMRNAKEPTELKSVNVLSWQQKHKLAIGIGDALSYLHDCFKSAVVVKSSDVLLNDSLDPVVADVCLPCMLVEDPSDHLALYRPRKTRKDNENLDTFSLGTILLELAMGKPAISFTSHPEGFLVPLKKSIGNETRNTIRIEFDKASGATCKEIQRMWKMWMLLCFQKTIQIDHITQIIRG